MSAQQIYNSCTDTITHTHTQWVPCDQAEEVGDVVSEEQKVEILFHFLLKLDYGMERSEEWSAERDTTDTHTYGRNINTHTHTLHLSVCPGVAVMSPSLCVCLCVSVCVCVCVCVCVWVGVWVCV